MVYNQENMTNTGRISRSHHSIVTGETGEQTCTSSDLVSEQEVQLHHPLFLVFSPSGQGM